MVEVQRCVIAFATVVVVVIVIVVAPIQSGRYTLASLSRFMAAFLVLGGLGGGGGCFGTISSSLSSWLLLLITNIRSIVRSIIITQRR